MYAIFSDISRFISEPFSILAHSYMDLPLLATIFLGIIGSVAPCQLTGNMSAITYYGSRTIEKKTDWIEVLLFIFGKIVVFSVLGIFVWIFGQSFEQSLIQYFPFIRKLVGPFVVFGGFVLLGVFRLKMLSQFTSKIPQTIRKGKFGSFMMGVTFSIAFCPTMFVLFFVTLMPMVLSTSYGFILPSIFGVFTSLPLLIILGVMWFLELDNRSLQRSKKIGYFVQKAAGIVLVIVGVLDTITYWTI